MDNPVVSIPESDIDLLSRLLFAEAGHEGPVGRQAVMATIFNRAAAGKKAGFPTSVRDVMLQKGQFEPLVSVGYKPDKLRPAPANIAKEVRQWLTAPVDPTNGAVFFQNKKVTDKRGTTFADGVSGTQIGKHTFYNQYSPDSQAVSVPEYTVSYNNGDVSAAMTRMTQGNPEPQPQTAQAVPSGQPGMSRAVGGIDYGAFSQAISSMPQVPQPTISQTEEFPVILFGQQ